MPIGILGGVLGAIGKKVLPKVAKAVGGIVAKKVGKKATKVAVAVGGAIGAEKIARKVAGARVGGPVPATFENVVAGSSSSAPRGGRYYRRINPSNPKALRRAVRRVDRAKDMFGKVLAATRATSHSGFKIKPKRPRRKS